MDALHTLGELASAVFDSAKKIGGGAFIIDVWMPRFRWANVGRACSASEIGGAVLCG